MTSAHGSIRAFLASFRLLAPTAQRRIGAVSAPILGALRLGLATTLAATLAATLASLATLLAAPAHAEPVQLPMQGRLAAAGGGPVTDGGYPMAIGVYDASTGGKQLNDETFLNVPVAGGVFALSIGAAKVKLDSDVLAGTTGSVWLGITVAGEAELPRIAL